MQPRRTPTARDAGRDARAELDVALVHMHRGDQGGTGQCLGIDPYFDDLMCMAAASAFMSVEKIVDTEELPRRPARSTIRDQPAR